MTAALREALALATAEGLLAVILPDSLVPHLSGHSAYDDGIPLLSPRRAKGLEFDHVVVVEPALIAEGETGLRELYVALARADEDTRRRPFPSAAGRVVHATLRLSSPLPNHARRAKIGRPPSRDQEDTMGATARELPFPVWLAAIFGFAKAGFLALMGVIGVFA